MNSEAPAGYFTIHCSNGRIYTIAVVKTHAIGKCHHADWGRVILVNCDYHHLQSAIVSAYQWSQHLIGRYHDI